MILGSIRSHVGVLCRVQNLRVVLQALAAASLPLWEAELLWGHINGDKVELLESLWEHGSGARAAGSAGAES